MKLTIMGSGTSTGVPQIGCHCATCTSLDPHDRRLRASAIVTLDNGANLLIDCGPDFREQILSIGAPELEALLITHSHYDHVGGIDDLRPYCKGDRHFPHIVQPMWLPICASAIPGRLQRICIRESRHSIFMKLWPDANLKSQARL